MSYKTEGLTVCDSPQPIRPQLLLDVKQRTAPLPQYQAATSWCNQAFLATSSSLVST
jgi:hypothetical protein